MKVTLKSSCIVQPSQPTWKGCMPLTEFDQTGVLAHLPTIYLYRPSENWLDDAILKTLKTSLSKVLTHFYPLAGRLRWLDGARLELDCNGHGVHVLEASCEANLDDLLSDYNAPSLSHDLFNHLMPQIDYLATPIEEIPLLVVKLTHFQCGGISLSYTISHVVVDGQSALHFFSEWARLARGEPLGAPPFLDRKILRAGDPPPATGKPYKAHIHHLKYDTPKIPIGQENETMTKTTITAMLKLSKTQVETLKNEANKNDIIANTTRRGYSRFEAIAGHIWRCMCMARGNTPEQPTGLGFCVDIRKRMDPPLPPKFFSSAIVDMIATSCSKDLIKKPLSYAAERIRDAIDSVTSEYVHSAIDYFKNMKDFSGLQDIQAMMRSDLGRSSASKSDHIGVVSWIDLPLYNLDFGWGKEIFMSPRIHDSDGLSLILPGYDDGDHGSLVTLICLESAFMGDFKNFFYRDIQVYMDN